MTITTWMLGKIKFANNVKQLIINDFHGYTGAASVPAIPRKSSMTVN